MGSSNSDIHRQTCENQAESDLGLKGKNYGQLYALLVIHSL